MNAMFAGLWTHADAVLIVGPILAGVVTTILPPGRTASASALAVSAAAAVFSLIVLARIDAGVTHPSIDALGALAGALVAVVGAASFATFSALAPQDYSRRLRPVALGLGLVVMGAALGAVIERDALRVVLLSQAMFLGAAALTGVSALRDRRAATAAFGGVIVALGAGAIALFGAGLLHGAVGVFALDDIAARVGAGGVGHSAWLGAALLLMGLAALAGLAPLHADSADRAARTSYGAAALVTIVARTAAVIALVRVYAMTQSIATPHVASSFAYVVAGLGAVSVVAGALHAIAATDTRRLASHALTAQFGCALIGLAAGGTDGAVAALFVLAAGALTTLAIVVGAAAGRSSMRAGAPMAVLDGLSRSRPLVAASIMVAALGLTGAPLTAAFLGKWLSIEAALARGWYWAAAAIVASSFAAVFVAGQIVERIYFRERPAALGAPAATVIALIPALAVSVLATLVFGWSAGAPLEAARLAAGVLATSAPAP